MIDAKQLAKNSNSAVELYKKIVTKKAINNKKAAVKKYLFIFTIKLF